MRCSSLVRRGFLLLVPLSIALSSACDPVVVPPADGGNDGGMGSSTRLVFAPAPGAIDFGRVPFPDDLYLDAEGHLELGDLPSEAQAFPDYAATVRSAATELDGFGVLGPVYFFADGEIDRASLPDAPLQTLTTGSSVFLVDADPGSPSAFDRIPVEVTWNPTERAISVRPWEGHALRAGRTYAAVVTRAVRGMDGLPLSPSEDFAMVRDAASRPTDPTLGEAWERYQPVLRTLGVPATDVVGLAVFHVQTVEPGLVDARAVVRGGAVPEITIVRAIADAQIDELLGTPSMDVPGLDVMGGVQHTHIGTVVDGHFDSPNFMSEMVSTHGAFTRDATGDLVVRRRDQVWFTLVMPRGDVSALRAVIFQHGLGGERSSLFAIADSLCAQGWAVLAIDIPFHGMRVQAESAFIDVLHNYGPGTGPDFFGDINGGAVYVNFVGANDEMGGLSPFHPFYVRDVLRQSVVDLMMLARVIDEGDWGPVTVAGGPMGVGFADAPLGFVGISLGGIVGTTFVTMEPSVGAAVLNVTGGGLTQLVAGSASFRSTFLPLVAPRVGMRFSAVDEAVVPARLYPELAVYQLLMDGGDSSSFAPILAERQTEVLFQLAVDDETLPNQSTEGLARSAGAAIAGGMARYTDLPTTMFPISANVSIGDRMVTRGLVPFEPATHGLLSRRADFNTVVHPVEPPFMPLMTPTAVANDVDGAMTQLVRFFESWRMGAATIEAP